MARNLGSIPLSEVQGNVFDASYFVRVDGASPIGVQRFTDRNASVTINIDGSVQSATITNAGSGYGTPPTVTFSAPPAGGILATGTATVSGGLVTGITITNAGYGYTSAPTISFAGGGGINAAATANLTNTWAPTDFILGALNQSAQSVANVSSILFANLDCLWTGWAISPGLRGAVVRVWDAYFNRSTGALIDKVKLFEGTIDSGEFGERAQIALAPYLKPWSRQVPSITGLMLGATPLMPDTSVTIRWVDSVGSIVGYKPRPTTSSSGGGAPVPVGSGGFSWGDNPFANLNHVHHR